MGFLFLHQDDELKICLTKPDSAEKRTKLGAIGATPLTPHPNRTRGRTVSTLGFQRYDGIAWAVALICLAWGIFGWSTYVRKCDMGYSYVYIYICLCSFVDMCQGFRVPIYIYPGGPVDQTSRAWSLGWSMDSGFPILPMGISLLGLDFLGILYLVPVLQRFFLAFRWILMTVPLCHLFLDPF